MNEDWGNQGASELGRGIASGRIDPAELAGYFLERIAGHPDANRVFARVTHERAMSEAQAATARARAGHRRGLLDGVPLSWKDLFDSAGIRTEAGSALLKGRTPASDARLLRIATSGGSVCLGKTHMSELAFSGLGLNPVTATPPCVNDPGAVPGGSSSGAAASVALGLAPAAIGSDTGGSVRIPAVWNDLVGLKTTHGRLSLEGVVPLASAFDSVGPLCRNVEDASRVLALLEGRPPADLTAASLKGVRLMVLDTVAFDNLHDGPAKGFEGAARRLERAGAKITHGDMPEIEEADALSGVLYGTEAYAEWKELIEATPHAMFERILERFRAGAGYSGTEYLNAWNRLRTIRQIYREKTAAFDAVILPTCPILPPDKARLESDRKLYNEQNLLTLRNTRIASLMGLAALTLPTQVKSAGIMLQGATGADERLLRLGAAAERALA